MIRDAKQVTAGNQQRSRFGIHGPVEFRCTVCRTESLHDNYVNMLMQYTVILMAVRSKIFLFLLKTTIVGTR